MRKIAVIGISILSVFILCSLSYQPMIAEVSIIESKDDRIPIESEDCGCSSNINFLVPPKLFCDLLYELGNLLVIKYFILLGLARFVNTQVMLYVLAFMAIITEVQMDLYLTIWNLSGCSEYWPDGVFN